MSVYYTYGWVVISELGKTFLGSLWISFGLGILLYWYHYFSYYHKGYRLNQKSFQLGFDDLE